MPYSPAFSQRGEKKKKKGKNKLLRSDQHEDTFQVLSNCKLIKRPLPTVLHLHDLKKSRVRGEERVALEDSANFFKLTKEKPNDWTGFKGVS